MSVDKTQSALKEVRDQLFLDTADGVRLDVVTSNLGLDRPEAGLTDDEWRALAKQIALQPKLIRNAFYRTLEVCLGPQKTRIAHLSANATTLDTQIVTVDGENLVQLGTLILSPGQSTEETVSFCLRDIASQTVYLESALTNDHSAVESAVGNIAATTAATAATLVLVDSSNFPTTGYPYSIIVDRGTSAQETLVVTDNDTATNTLTLLNSTTKDHNGPIAKFLRKPLSRASVVGEDFIQLAASATRSFPATGWIRIDFGGTEETHEYTANNVTNNTLSLKRVLASAHAIGDSIELVSQPATVETCSMIQQGTAWEIFETTDNTIKIYVPDTEEGFRLLDASYLHDSTPAAASSTLAADTTTTGTTIELADSSGFPATGIIEIDSAVTKFYTLNDTDNNILHLTTEVGAVYSLGDSVVLQLVNYASTDLDEGNFRDVSGVVQENKFPGPYLYDPTQAAPSFKNTTTLAETIAPPTRVVVDQGAGRTAIEVMDAGLLPAPTFDVRIGRTSGSEETRTVTDVTLQGDAATTLNAGFAAGVTTLTVADSTDFPESNGTNSAGYRIIIDRGNANEEVVRVFENTAGSPGTFTLETPTLLAHSNSDDVELLSDVLTVDPLVNSHTGPTIAPSRNGHLVELITTTLDVASASGFDPSGKLYINFGKSRTNVRKRITSVVSTTVLEFDDTSVFPTGDFPYRIVVGEGKTIEEYAFVSANNTGTNRLTVNAALAGSFAAGDYVEFRAGDPISLDYTSIDGTEITLTNPSNVMPSIYTLGESVIPSFGDSVPATNGNDYALLLPPTLAACLTFVLNLIRAAGIEVIFIEDK